MATIAWDGEAGDGDFTNPLNWEGDVLPGSSDSAVVHPTFGPPIELKAGEFIHLDSLDLDWPMEVSGGLYVSGRTRIGPEQFSIAEGGQARTINLTLWESQVRPAGEVTNLGIWRIGGTSSLQTSVTNRGELTLDYASFTTLSDPINHETVRLDCLGGELVIGDFARVNGASGSFHRFQILVDTLLDVGHGAVISNCGIEADGDGAQMTVRLASKNGVRASILGKELVLGDAMVVGKFETYGTNVTFGAGCTLNAELRASDGFIRATHSVASESGGLLDLIGGNLILGVPNQTETVTLGMRGSVTSGVVGADQHAVLERFTLVNVQVRGAVRLDVGVLDSVSIDVASEVHVLSAILQEQRQFSPNAPAAVQVRGTLVVGEQVRWESGKILLVFDESRVVIEEGARLLAIDTGITDRAITGSGMVTNAGEIEFLIREGDHATISATLDSPGRVSVTGGTLTISGEVVQLDDEGVLGGGEWHVGAGGDVVFGVSPMLRNQATILIGSGGSTGVLGSLTHNEGTIVLSGKNVWDDGDDGAISIVNRGTIRKVGKGALVIVGDVTHRGIATIEVLAGRLRLETEHFRNPGTIILGGASTALTKQKARLEISGSFEQTPRGILDVRGGRGDTLQSLPRLIVGERMELGGSLEASAFPRTFQPEPTESIWLLAAGRSRVGEFDSVRVRIKQSSETMLYTGKLAQIVATK